MTSYSRFFVSNVVIHNKTVHHAIENGRSDTMSAWYCTTLGLICMIRFCIQLTGIGLRSSAHVAHPCHIFIVGFLIKCGDVM